MNPEVGQHVVVFLRNGVHLEGDVILWSDDKSALQAPSGTTIVIQKTLEDVMFFKITNYRANYDELKEKPAKQEDDIKRLAELKNEINEMDRVDLREKMSSHQPDGMREVNYGLPWSNIKIQGTVKRPGEKVTRADPELGSELQNLFHEKRKGNRAGS